MITLNVHECERQIEELLNDVGSDYCTESKAHILTVDGKEVHLVVTAEDDNFIEHVQLGCAKFQHIRDELGRLRLQLSMILSEFKRIGVVATVTGGVRTAQTMKFSFIKGGE